MITSAAEGAPPEVRARFAARAVRRAAGASSLVKSITAAASVIKLLLSLAEEADLLLRYTCEQYTTHYTAASSSCLLTEAGCRR